MELFTPVLGRAVLVSGRGGREGSRMLSLEAVTVEASQRRFVKGDSDSCLGRCGSGALGQEVWRMCPGGFVPGQGRDLAQETARLRF